MEYIEGTKLSGDLRKETRDSLKKAVSLLHDNGYVHGDLRPPNILLKGSQPYVLDYEWSGLEGEATYPDNINSDCNEWHEGVQPCGKILKEHDRQTCTYITVLLLLNVAILAVCLQWVGP